MSVNSGSHFELPVLVYAEALPFGSAARRWVVANSYRVSFGHDPYVTSGGGMLSAFEPVPGTVYLDEQANLEVGVLTVYITSIKRIYTLIRDTACIGDRMRLEANPPLGVR